MDKIKKRIKELREEIIKHNKLYYTKGKPAVSDAAYDKLVKELKDLEKKHPEYDSADSPTRTVGASIPEKFFKVKHAVPMLSLESVNDEDGAKRFDKTCRKELGGSIEYMCEPKLDGISIELVYEKGKFVRGSTRGNGIIGEDVTLNLKTISSIPAELKTSSPPEHISIRGEVLMHIKDFHRLNKEQMEHGRSAFANPRNVAAGSMRQLDYRITGGRKLQVYCYRILEFTGKGPSSQKGSLELLKEYGFQISPKTRYCRDMDKAVKYHHDMEKKRDDLDYEIDGVVIKVNDISSQEKLGMRTTNPKWAVAYKFKARKEITRVEDIVVQVGRTGVLTPLALLQSVDIGGVIVARATLHNMDQVKKQGIKICDYVKVERAGDVIPYISEVVKEKRTGKEKEFKMPGKCPSCGAFLEKEEVFYRCPAGLACSAQVKEAIAHYVSKDAVDIEGFSDKTVEQLFENKMIKGIADIYTLKREDLLLLEGWKEKKTDNLLKAISKAKSIDLDRFIFALGIRNVGRHIAAVLADKFGTLENSISAGTEALTEIKEIGPEIALSIQTFFSKEKNLKEIKKLKQRGVVIKMKKKKTEGKLLGKKCLFTGSLQQMTRSEAKRLVEHAGGESASSMSSSIDLLIAGEKAGSKLAEAKKKGIKILSEEEFLKLVK